MNEQLNSVTDNPTTEPIKVCTKCQLPKPLSEFSKDKNRKDGLNPWCKFCIKKSIEESKERILQEHIKYQEKNPILFKICAYCKELKPVSNFHKSKSAKDGLNCRCKSCRKNDTKQRYLKNKDKIIIKSKKYQLEHKEQHKLSVKKHYIKHKPEISLYHKQWYLKNKDRVILQKKQWYLKNKDRVKLQKKRYDENPVNKEKRKEYDKKYKKKLRQTNPEVRIINNLQFLFQESPRASAVG